MKQPDIVTVARPVIDALERLGVEYRIGGSVASSAYGIATSAAGARLGSAPAYVAYRSRNMPSRASPSRRLTERSFPQGALSGRSLPWRVCGSRAATRDHEHSSRSFRPRRLMSPRTARRLPDARRERRERLP